MKQRILTIILLGGTLLTAFRSAAQCTSYFWGGITFASPQGSTSLHPNTIYVSWPASLNGEKYTVLYQDITTSGDWQTAVTNLNNWYYYISINTAHNYNVAVTVTCPDGTSKTDVRYQIAGENFSQIGNCIGVWNGLTTYSTDGTSLTVRWTDAKVDHYEVWTKLDDPFAYPAPEWNRETNNVSSFSYTITNLDAQESYYVSIIAVCRDGTRIERVHQFPIYIDGITTARCENPYGLTEIPSTTSAQLGGVIYTYLLGVNISYYITYSEASSGVYTTVPWTFPGLNQPSGVAVMKTITGLKPNTLYTWYITMVCNGFGQNTGYGFSYSSSFFTKPLPPGPCNSKQGNYTAPAINNTAGTDFYSGTITSASPVTLSTVAHKFTATAVQLNPGFNSAVSGSGSFIGNAFNPATCVATRMMNTEDSTLLTDTAIITETGPQTVVKKTNTTNGKAKDILLFPNPTTGNVSIYKASPDENIRTVRVTDAAGKEVLLLHGNQQRFDMGRLPAGFYFCTIQTDKGIYTAKIIRQ